MTKVLLLYDEITPALAKTFVGEMSRLVPTEPVVVAINSPGGHVISGDAIALSLDRHRGPTTARIDGIAASAASFVAMFCDRTIMPAGAFIMIHEPRVDMASASADDLDGASAAMRQIIGRYAATYATRSGQPEAKIREWMKAEKWFTASEAVEAGFADAVDTGIVLARKVSPMALQFKHTPSEVRAMAGGGRQDFDIVERRKRLRKRLMIIASQARLARDPVRERQDRERAARVAKRAVLNAQLDQIREDEARRDAEERAAAKRRLEADWRYDRLNVPREQRRY